MNKIRIEVLLALKDKGPVRKLSVEFRHVYRFLFNGKGKPAEQCGWMLFEDKDFVKCELPSYWYCIHDQHGDGTKVKFPVKIRTFIARSPKKFTDKNDKIVQLPCSFIEKLSITFIKVASSCL